jgi:hypothetical protein
MRRTWHLALLAALSFVGPRPAGSQHSPAEVAAAFFKAVAEERWRDAARELDLAALDRYRRERIAAARLPQPRSRPMTVDEYLRHDPDMPRAVAEYHVRKLNEAPHDPREWVLREFADVRDIDALAALSAEESAARWLQAQDVRWAVRRAMEEQRKRGCLLPAETAEGMPAPDHRIVGAVLVDSTTAYVLHQEATMRRADPDVEAAVYAEPPRVMTLRRRSDRWRILPRQEALHGTLGITVMSTLCMPRERPPR